MKERIGNYIIGFAIMLVIAFSIIVKSDGVNSYDLLGLTIPHAPLWTSYIPYIGYFLNFFVELFSLHGVVLMTIFFILLAVGLHFKNRQKSFGIK